MGTVIANILSPIMNMLTDKRQHEYKSHKSSIDVVCNIKRGRFKSNVSGKYYYFVFLMHSAELAGRTMSIWKRGPLKPYQGSKKGRSENMIRSDENWKYRREINSNVGVSQGTPLSAERCITYADHVIGGDTARKLKNAPITIEESK